ncbi:type II toxin-antitoxin system RelE/ParE family toxin [Varibaculum vaginae]|uniref:type II toxin-antitoxin system RelE/ParE family toxin n=1 Tax=Varibaculum vaginae TaxID=2364797 RepID=UPI000F07B7FE|nr:type II toxin-antitoxin system RelE/ParE family toxin [Varibaculum vaginae]
MSAKFTVSYTRAAYNDLRGITSYISYSLLAPESAKRQTESIREQIRDLDTLPLRYPLVGWEPWRSMGIRRVITGKYVIFYEVDEDQEKAEVIRVVYSGRNLKEIAKDIGK